MLSKESDNRVDVNTALDVPGNRPYGLTVEARRQGRFLLPNCAEDPIEIRFQLQIEAGPLQVLCVIEAGKFPQKRSQPLKYNRIRHEIFSITGRDQLGIASELGPVSPHMFDRNRVSPGD